MDVIKFFSHIEVHARKELNSVEQTKGAQPGPRVAALHLVGHHAEILLLESKKHIKVRNHWQIAHSWKIISKHGKEQGLFKTFDGNAELREKLLYFLNGKSQGV